jgi:hypothetical protein
MALLTLADTEPEVVTIRIVRVGGEPLEFPMAVPSVAQFDAWGAEVEAPKPPMRYEDIPGVSDRKRRVPDTDAPEYKEAMALYRGEVMKRRLAGCLLAAGHFADMKGDMDKAVAALNQLPTPIYNGLMDGLAQVVSGVRAHIDARAHTFRGPDAADTPDV